jgi:hypothetical protein
MNTLKTEQDPIFLRGVEENPKPSVYRDLIENAKAAGTDYWQTSPSILKPPITSPPCRTLSCTRSAPSAPACEN